MAGRGRGWGAVAESGRNHFHYPLDIPEHVVVPETQHAIAARFEVRGSSRIGIDASRFIVLSTIDLDHKPRPMAAEVSEVWSDRRLSPEMRAIHGEMAQMQP
jgi:hypothetical protein